MVAETMTICYIPSLGCAALAFVPRPFLGRQAINGKEKHPSRRSICQRLMAGYRQLTTPLGDNSNRMLHGIGSHDETTTANRHQRKPCPQCRLFSGGSKRGGGLGGLTPRTFLLFACQYENSHGLAFSRTLTPLEEFLPRTAPPPSKNS